MKKLITLFCLCSLSPLLQAYDFAAVAENHILPVYRELEKKTGILNTEAVRYCTNPTDAAAGSLKTAYTEAFLSWQGTRHINTGPIQYLSREHRYALWPDKRGTVSKHLGRILADKSLGTEGIVLAKKSIAIQGFTALERLLYPLVKNKKAECFLLRAIALNLHSMSQGVLTDWEKSEDSYLPYFSQPSEDNPFYESADELAGILLNGMYTELELIVTAKLARPMGETLAKSRGKKAEGWRSEMSMPAIRQNLAATQALFVTAFEPALKDQGLIEKIKKQFAQAIAQTDSIKQPIKVAVTLSADRAALVELSSMVSVLKRLLTQDMAQGLDLVLGFNSLDGD